MATIEEIRNGTTRIDDWDGYGAGATTDAALEAAQRFSEWAAPKFPEWIDAFLPASDGGIMLDHDMLADGGGGILIEWEPDGSSVANTMMERLTAGYAGVDDGPE